MTATNDLCDASIKKKYKSCWELEGKKAEDQMSKTLNNSFHNLSQFASSFKRQHAGHGNFQIDLSRNFLECKAYVIFCNYINPYNIR